MANILVAIDNTMPPLDVVEYAIKIARGTNSGLIVLGIIPAYLYTWETVPVEIEEATRKTLNSVKEAAERSGIKVIDIIRSGYPDEEIMKISTENNVSVVIIPTRKGIVSELRKAATILVNKFAGSLNQPLILVPV